MDVVMPVPKFPEAGNWVFTTGAPMITPGGKGANQALAAARAGAKTYMVGCVGDDVYAPALLRALKRDGVHCGGVAVTDKTSTGLIVMQRRGVNDETLTIADAANHEARAEQVPDDMLGENTILILQGGVRPEENSKLIHRAKKGGARVMMNLSAVYDIPAEDMAALDHLVVNEKEARIIARNLGLPDDKAASFVERFPQLTCAVTRGDKAINVAGPNGVQYQHPVRAVSDVVDTTGAGDALLGTLAAGLSMNLPYREALYRGMITAGLVCQKKGAMDSFPYLADIEAAIAADQKQKAAG